MDLIFINDQNIAKIDVNEPLGNLEVAKLEIDPQVKPKILPCRNISLSPNYEVKAEIDRSVRYFGTSK